MKLNLDISIIDLKLSSWSRKFSVFFQLAQNLFDEEIGEDLRWEEGGHSYRYAATFLWCVVVYSF